MYGNTQLYQDPECHPDKIRADIGKSDEFWDSPCSICKHARVYHNVVSTPPEDPLADPSTIFGSCNAWECECSG